MRYEYAVSDIIGAVILIGVVMGGMGLIGVILLSTPPPDETPKASVSSYCVRCDLKGTYEVIMYHGGGQALDRNKIQFFLHTRDGTISPITPWWVYDSTPEDCMYSDIGESSHSTRETWRSSDQWKSGNSLRFRFSSLSDPTGLDIRYYPYKSSMITAEFKEDIRNSTCVKENNPDECMDPTVELTPVLKNVTLCTSGCSGYDCRAVFTYNLTGSFTIPYSMTKPYNFVEGSDSHNNLTNFSSTGAGNDTISVNFSKRVRWWLGRSIDSGNCVVS